MVVNYVLYHAGWIACILGAAAHRPVAGLAVALALTAAHLWLVDDRPAELRLVAATLAIGLVVEAAMTARGIYRFTSGSVVTWMSPPWLLAMWAQFATTFRFTARAVLASPTRSALFGVLGGPIAFYAGERLGAVTLAQPVLPTYVTLGLAWGVALLVCALALPRLTRGVRTATYRAL
jgi:hypothetical protein